MFTNRQIHILKLIIENPNGISGYELSNILKVSDRTIRTEIQSINTILFTYQCKVQGKQTMGYFIDGQHFETIEWLIEECGDIEDDDRLVQLLNMILRHRQIQLDDLANKLFISEHTLLKDLHQLKALFQRFEVDLFYRVINYEVVVISDIYEFRKIIFRLIKHKIFGNRSIQIDNHFIKQDKMIKKILNMLPDPLTEMEFDFIAIALNFIDYENTNHFVLNDRPVILNHQMQHIYEHSNLNISKVDLYQLQLELEVFKYTLDYNHIVSAFIEDIHHQYQITLNNDSLLSTNFIKHLNLLMNRSVEHISVLKQQYNLINKRYLYSYEIAMSIVPIIHQYFNYYISKEEVGLVAVYIEQLIVQQEKPLQAIIVGESDDITTIIMNEYIEKQFKDRIHVIQTTPKHCLNTVQSHYDLIITNQPNIKHDKKVYQLCIIPTDDDRRHLLNLMSQIKREGKYVQLIDQYFKEKDIIIYNKKGNISNQLIEMVEGQESKIIKDEVAIRNNIYQTSLSKWCKLIQPISSINKQIRVGVAVPSTKFLEKHNDAKMYLYVSKSDVYDQGMYLLYVLIKELSTHPNLVQKLANCKTNKEVIDELRYYAKFLQYK